MCLQLDHSKYQGPQGPSKMFEQYLFWTNFLFFYNLLYESFLTNAIYRLTGEYPIGEFFHTTKFFFLDASAGQALKKKQIISVNKKKLSLVLQSLKDFYVQLKY